MLWLVLNVEDEDERLKAPRRSDGDAQAFIFLSENPDLVSGNCPEIGYDSDWDLKA
jgi:hypothetical protein